MKKDNNNIIIKKKNQKNQNTFFTPIYTICKSQINKTSKPNLKIIKKIISTFLTTKTHKYFNFGY